MKRLFLFTALLVLFVSCQDDDSLMPQQRNIKAILPTLADDIQCRWTAGDHISVFALTHLMDEDAGYLQYDHCQFTATGPGATSYVQGEAPKGAESFVGVYPYSQDNAMNGTGFKVIIPEVQTAATADSEDFPLWAWAVAYPDNLVFNFQPLGAYFSFSFSDADITSARITVEGDAIAGVFLSYPDKNRQTLAEWDYEPTYWEVDALPPADVFQSGVKYYILVAPNTFTQVSATLFQNGKATELSVLDGIRLAPGDIVDLGSFKAK